MPCVWRRILLRLLIVLLAEIFYSNLRILAFCDVMGLLKKIKDKTEESAKKVGKEGAKLGKMGLKETGKNCKERR